MDKLHREAEQLLNAIAQKRQEIQELRDRENILLGMCLASPKLAKEVLADQDAVYGLTSAARYLLTAIADQNRSPISNALTQCGVATTKGKPFVTSMLEDAKRRGKLTRMRDTLARVANYNPLYPNSATVALIEQLSVQMATETQELYEAYEQQAAEQGGGMPTDSPSPSGEGEGVHDLPSEPEQARSEQATGA